MRYSPIPLLLLLATACSQAGDRVDQYLVSIENSLNTTSLFYKRLSPEVAAKIKPVTIPDEAKSVAECVVNQAEEQGALDAFDKSMQYSDQMMKYIVDTPELTLLTITQDEGFIKMQEAMADPEFDVLTKISKDCGVIDMNIKLSQSTGVLEAMKSIDSLGG